MASMRNGCGDEWFCLFDSNGWAALKGLDHESKAWASGGERLSQALRDSIPELFQPFSIEPAFRWDSTSFAFYCMDESHTWVRVIENTKYSKLSTGEDELLSILLGSPKEYVRYAKEYLERDIDETIVASIFAGDTIIHHTISTLNPGLDVSAIANELIVEIGYPYQS